MTTIVAVRQSTQRSPHCFEVPVPLRVLCWVVLPLGAWSKHIDHGSPPLPSTAIHPPEPLYHAFTGNKVADHVIRIQVYADLSGGCGDQEGGRGGILLGSAEETVHFEPGLQGGPLPHPTFPYEKLRDMLACEFSGLVPSPALPVDQFLHLEGIPPPVAVDQHPGEWRVASNFDGSTSEGFGETRAGGQFRHLQPLMCRQALPNDQFLAVFGF
ncbi:MAG: hypothetical protein F4089_04595 [Gammaproteobacteria bacterium]|nr:hypothetical protein [Gammaproteobacteria bacterium]